ncbi:helix-turn-helix transcriptional regulator [Flavobacterium poyangense]|uniref:helix-turn-helix transcriptional regulator n=1 Tax=Flavobacterium poyangense TaxID=2204302 RepID=UPI0014205344|nr:helix-turn-helix transcriptional regulator [Flavobacterium sp. JXAS1]
MKKKLLNARLNKGFSQEELADLVGMSQANYSRRENGLKKISEAEWTKLAKHLGLEKEDIYEIDTICNSSNEYPLKAETFTIPKFIMDHIELLQEKNRQLEEKLKSYES